jgi:hypothetical protein
MPATHTLSITKKINSYLLFFIICLSLYLPSSFLRGPFYPDEVRNIYIVKNISNFKDYFFLKYLGKNYYDKPPFYFWFLKSFFNISPKKPLVLPILFNVLLCWGILSLNYFFLKREGFPREGFISSLLLSTVGIFYGMAIIVRMDILFLFLIYLSLFFMWLSLTSDKKYYIFLSFLCSFLAVFTKGALGVVFPFFIGVAASIFFKNWHALKKVIIINSLTIVAVLIWLFSFSQIDHNYFRKMFFDQTISRLLSSTSHSHSLFYYLPFYLLLNLPWSFLGMGYFLRFKKNNISHWEKLFLVWLVGGFIIISFIRHKLPMYLLLLTIPFSGLTAKFFVSGDRRLRKRLFFITSIFFLLFWCITFFFFKVNNKFILPHTLLILPFFITVVFMIKKNLFSRFKIFYIYWFIIIQIINFIYLPFASSLSVYNKLLLSLKRLKLSFNKIYVDDKALCQLSIYPMGKPVIYLREKLNICNEESFIFISKEENTPCSLKEICKIDDFYFFTKRE